MNNWLKKLKKKAILPAAAFLVAAAAIGTTFAWQQWDLSITNNLVSHTVVVKENENFDPKDGTKDVRFSNTGNDSVFLRVSYSEYWIKGEEALPDNKNEGPHWIDTNGNTTNILSNIVDGSEVAVKTWGDNWPLTSSPSSTDIWFKAPDGWYYYKKVLKAKGSDMSSTQHVLESVKFDPHLSNDGHINSDYSNTQIDLTIKGETVLVDERAVAEQWPNVTVSFIYDQEGDITAVDWNRKEN